MNAYQNYIKLHVKSGEEVVDKMGIAYLKWWTSDFGIYKMKFTGYEF